MPIDDRYYTFGTIIIKIHLSLYFFCVIRIISLIK